MLWETHRPKTWRSVFFIHLLQHHNFLSFSTGWFSSFAFILVNMFLSIVIENFKRVKRNSDLQSNKYEIDDFMTEQFMSWLGLRSRSIFRNRVFAEGDFDRPVYKKRRRTDEAAQLKDRVDRLLTLIQRVHCDVNEEDFRRNDGEVTFLKLINNSSRQNKENHNREGGLDTRS